MQGVGVNRVGYRSNVDGTRGVNLDEERIRQVQRSRRVFHPPLHDVVTLVLEKMANVPVRIMDAPAISLCGKVHRTSTIDLNDPPIQSQQFGFGKASLEMGFENHARHRGRQGVHHDVTRPAQPLRPLQITSPECIKEGLLDNIFGDERPLQLSTECSRQGRLARGRDARDDDHHVFHRMIMAGCPDVPKGVTPPWQRGVCLNTVEGLPA
jgi:hypothetical protein